MKRKTWPKTCASRRGSRKGARTSRVKQIDQVMDEIETITTDLDALLAQVPTAGAP